MKNSKKTFIQSDIWQSKILLLPMALLLWIGAFIIPSLLTNAILYASSHVLEVNPSSRDFGSVEVSSSQSQIFTVTNNDSVTISGSLSGLTTPFSCSGDCSGFTLPPGGSKNYTIDFQPTATGPASDTAVFTVNSGSNDSCSASASGPSVNGVCGPYNSGSGGSCSAGTYCGGSFSGGTEYWTCCGINGGSNDSCSHTSSFIAGTAILMADRSIKLIEDVAVGDTVAGSAGPNTVTALKPHPHRGAVYAINDNHHFVTPGHPFMTTEGWKAFDASLARSINPSLEIATLTVGDVLITQSGTITIENISSIPMSVPVYNFEVTGTRDYYANGFLVHNK